MYLFSGLVLFSACTSTNTPSDDNPLLAEYQTPFQTPPFDKIKHEHYVPAAKKGIEMQNQEIEQIVNNAEAPNFENTIAAFDHSGLQLAKVRWVFDNLTGANTDSTLQTLAVEIQDLLTKQKDNIYMNPKLFEKVKAVYDAKATANLNEEQTRLLDLIYRTFVRGGANLDADKKKRFSEINSELGKLMLQFGDNVLAETNEFKMFVEDKKQLEGMPEDILAAAADKAKQAGKEGQWLFTIDKPTLLPFLQYCPTRELREKLMKGYIMRGDNNNALDNKALIEKLVALRAEKAQILGYATFADYALDENMAKKPENVTNLLMKVWNAALPIAVNEVKDMQKIADKEGAKFKIEPWDWSFYAEKVRKEKYNFDEEAMRPYFKLENVRLGVFEVTKRLYGLTFEARKDIPVYHPDVEAYEVKDKDGNHLAVLYMDFFARASKRGGAWMSNYRDEWTEGGKRVAPIITNCFNFAKPTGDKPALLTFDDVNTVFHEFGHGLHGMLAQGNYRTTSGTSVALDFVELPSQILENWATDPEVLKLYAKHYQTGEVMPEELVKKMLAAGKFNQGFVTLEYTSAALLDMQYHVQKGALTQKVDEFESNYLKSIGLIPQIVVRYRSTYFSHIFAGEYCAGYYAYLWAEVLDADAFEAFKEKGIFDAATANAFKTNVLEKGNAVDPMETYRKFRGADPKEEALLKRRGLL